MTVEPQGGQVKQCPVTIRFPHIDAAGIVFYPRYFETVLRCFPDVPFSKTPFAVQTEFLRPNRLGDEITVRLARGPAAGGWSVSGVMGDAVHFSMRPLAGEGELSPGAHCEDREAYQTAGERIGEWCAGPGGRLHLSRYFEYLNIAIEEWFERTLGQPFRDLHAGRGIGIPTVSFKTHCRSLPELGEEVATWIRLQRIGSRSLSFTSWLVGNGQCHVENEQVVVFVNMQGSSYSSTPIPDDVREQFAAQWQEAIPGDRERDVAT